MPVCLINAMPLGDKINSKKKQLQAKPTAVVLVVESQGRLVRLGTLEKYH